MKCKKLAILTITAIISVTTYGQLFQPLGLGTGIGERQGEYSQPRMHIEGSILYVCTNQGLFSKDLADDSSTWQLAGFEGIPLQDYARRGSDILALRYNRGGGFLLLSHDGGQTYEDVTPDIFRQEKYEVLPSLAQHPADSSTLLVSSLYGGIFRSTDFGQTWENLLGYMYGNGAASFIGFHLTQPSILYNSGEGAIFDGHIIVSYDEGQTWNDHGSWSSGDEWIGFPGDNCVHRPTFHPTNPNHWLAGGEGCVFRSDDNGRTWSCQNYWGDESRDAYWYFSAFDYEHPDTIYMAGNTIGDQGAIKVMCSTDGGSSWEKAQIEPRKKLSVESVNDMQQYGDNLLIYTESDVYKVSKTELIAQSTASVHSIICATQKDSSKSYDLQGRRIILHGKGIYLKNKKKHVKSY